MTDTIETASYKDVHRELKDNMEEISKDLADFIINRITESLEVDGSFNVTTFFRLTGNNKERNHVFHSNYRNEILRKASSRMNNMGYSSKLWYDEDDNRVNYTTRIQNPAIAAVAKLSFRLLMGYAIAYAGTQGLTMFYKYMHHEGN